MTIWDTIYVVSVVKREWMRHSVHDTIQTPIPLLPNVTKFKIEI